MQEAWHAIKWYWLAVMAIYFAVQVAAVWRWKGVQKKRSFTVAIAMLVVSELLNAIRDVFFFESRQAHFVTNLIVGIAAFAAMINLVVMYGEGSADAPLDKDDERKFQVLNLS